MGLGNPNDMEGNAAIFNTSAVLVSAGTAALSALCALLTFLLSRKLSRRDMVDTLKIEILQLVSSVERQRLWLEAVNISRELESGGIGPKIGTLAKLLGSKYEKKTGYC